MSDRDNFTKATIDILAKRVGYLCSNPSCRQHTIGPSNNPEKATTIGIAGHITAASPGGPRYEPLFSEEQRIHIDNGIWLCSNCSTLIDKDESRFPVPLIQKWKNDAENELLEHLLGKKKRNGDKPLPFLEADLIWNGAIRSNRGYSPKNPTRIEGGVEVMVINIAEKAPIIFWAINRRFLFSIHNNSSVPAYNVKIEEVGDIKFDTLTKLNNINNLPPYKSVDLEATYSQYMESDYIEADKMMTINIPPKLEGLTLKISYQDDGRNDYSTLVKIENGALKNTRD